MDKVRSEELTQALADYRRTIEALPGAADTMPGYLLANRIEERIQQLEHGMTTADRSVTPPALRRVDPVLPRDSQEGLDLSGNREYRAALTDNIAIATAYMTALREAK